MSHVRFKKGSSHYIVFEDVGAETGIQIGVTVQKDGKKVTSLQCKDGYLSLLEGFVLEKNGLTGDEKDC